MIRTGRDTDKTTLMNLWKMCFPMDSDRFIHFYFNNIYKNDETLVYVENNQAVASLQMIPYRIKTRDSLLRGGYISGAMTHPDYRKKGFMAKLLHASFDEMIKKGYDYTFLIPQEKELIEMYSKYGFRLCEQNQDPPENFVVKSQQQWAQLQRMLFDEKGVWLDNEPAFPHEQKGMIKRLNPAAKEISSLYMGMMMDT